jgi:hypothetical protein
LRIRDDVSETSHEVAVQIRINGPRVEGKEHAAPGNLRRHQSLVPEENQIRLAPTRRDLFAKPDRPRLGPLPSTDREMNWHTQNPSLVNWKGSEWLLVRHHEEGYVLKPHVSEDKFLCDCSPGRKAFARRIADHATGAAEFQSQALRRLLRDDGNPRAGIHQKCALLPVHRQRRRKISLMFQDRCAPLTVDLIGQSAELLDVLTLCLRVCVVGEIPAPLIEIVGRPLIPAGSDIDPRKQLVGFRGLGTSWRPPDDLAQ